MSKEIYIVNCYTCQHNGQETCKGCNTLLNGDVEPYENWELREDLSQKDQRIAELEQKLAELKEKAIVPRFKIGQRIWHLLCNNSSSCVVTEDVITNIEDGIYSLKKCRFCAIEEDLFATEQEAQAKLKEIQGNE